MDDLSEEQKTEYFRQSYTEVDRLWFMKVEERMGFEQALQIDETVWEVLPKIQVRPLKAMMNLPSGLEGLEPSALRKADSGGLRLRDKAAEWGNRSGSAELPWHQIMIKSGRGNISEWVSDVICRVVNETWASEFS